MPLFGYVWNVNGTNQEYLNSANTRPQQALARNTIRLTYTRVRT
jgi:hypothetical protein